VYLRGSIPWLTAMRNMVKTHFQKFIKFGFIGNNRMVIAYFIFIAIFALT